MTSRNSTTLAISLLCENPQKFTGLNSLFREFVSRSLRMDEGLKWIVFVGPDHDFGLCHERLTLVRAYPGNNHLVRRLWADHFLVSSRARRMGASLLLTVGFVPIRQAIPTVMHLFTLHHLDRSNRAGALRSFYRGWAIDNGLRRARLVISNSQFAVSQIVASAPSAAPKLMQSYEGINHEEFKPDGAPGEWEAMARSLRIQADYILSLSNLYPYKQVDLVVRAYAKLPVDRQQKYALVFVGLDWNEQKASLEALAKSLGVRGELIFLGWVEDRWIPALLRHARVFVLSSREETFGRPVAEAMACGTPSLVNDIPVMREITAGAAMIADYRDSAATATMLQSILADEPERAELIGRGLARAKDFDFDKLTQERMAAINSLLDRLKSRPSACAT